MGAAPAAYTARHATRQAASGPSAIITILGTAAPRTCVPAGSSGGRSTVRASLALGRSFVRLPTATSRGARPARRTANETATHSSWDPSLGSLEHEGSELAVRLRATIFGGKPRVLQPSSTCTSEMAAPRESWFRGNLRLASLRPWPRMTPRVLPPRFGITGAAGSPESSCRQTLEIVTGSIHRGTL